MVNTHPIITCPHCGTKNRLSADKSKSQAKCGRCHQPLINKAHTDSNVVLTLRCNQCHTKNRVPVSKLNTGAKCGRCKTDLQHQDVFTGRTVMVTDANFDQMVLKSPLPVLMYSWAPWCSVCSGTGPMVDQLAGETKGKVRVAKLNTEANGGLAARFNILSVPSFFIFDNGQLKGHYPGAVPKHDLMMKMAPFI